jgi:hypothetical protein
MQITPDTLNLLKNFSSINPSLMIRSGNVLKTVSEQKTVMAKAVISETFPIDFPIYDLGQFLGAISLFKNPDLEFTDKFVTASEGRAKVRYRAAAADLVTSAPEKDINVDAAVTFELTGDDFQSVIKAAQVLSLPEIHICGADGIVTFAAADSADAGANTFSREVGETDRKFKQVIRVEYLKFLPRDFTVSIASRGVVKFEAKDVTYWTATEANKSSME